MPDIPQAAVDAAAEALREYMPGSDDQDRRFAALEALRAAAPFIVSAAAPLIAANERGRIRQLAIEHGAQYDIDVVGGLPFTDLIGDPGAT